MNMLLTLRATLVVSASAAALSAYALDAFSSLDSLPTAYSSGGSYDVSPSDDAGFQFITVAGGTLTGFQVAMNDQGNLTPKSFNFALYTDSGSDTLGTLLGSWTGSSSGVDYTTTTSTLVSIPATGPAINLLSGTKYWVYATQTDPNSVTFWNLANSGTVPRIFAGGYANATQAAYSVQVRAVPEPGTMAALGMGALALMRRRNKA